MKVTEIEITISNADTKNMVGSCCHVAISYADVPEHIFPSGRSNACKPQKGVVHVIGTPDRLNGIKAPQIIQPVLCDKTRWDLPKSRPISVRANQHSSRALVGRIQTQDLTLSAYPPLFCCCCVAASAVTLTAGTCGHC